MLKVGCNSVFIASNTEFATFLSSLKCNERYLWTTIAKHAEDQPIMPTRGIELISWNDENIILVGGYMAGTVTLVLSNTDTYLDLLYQVESKIPGLINEGFSPEIMGILVVAEKELPELYDFDELVEEWRERELNPQGHMPTFHA